MDIYTIGFTKKTAKHFFELLGGKNIVLLLDIRLNNKSQLAAFTKDPDLEYFLKEILNITYVHDIMFAPTKEMLDDYKNKKIDWHEYKKAFHHLMKQRKIYEYFVQKYGDVEGNICLLCSEPSNLECHRGIVAEIISTEGNLKSIHL